jgi:hypothetical protein
MYYLNLNSVLTIKSKFDGDLATPKESIFYNSQFYFLLFIKLIFNYLLHLHLQ